MITRRDPRSLPQEVEAVPVSAEILNNTCCQLESRTEPSVLEEDVRVAQTRGVQVLPLPLLREDAVDALDQADLLEVRIFR